jgi:hypothetical protein
MQEKTYADKPDRKTTDNKRYWQPLKESRE